MGDHINISIGGGFTTLLAILFIAFKLAGIIDWSWFWVLSPIWISLVVVILVFIIIIIIALID